MVILSTVVFLPSKRKDQLTSKERGGSLPHIEGDPEDCTAVPHGTPHVLLRGRHVSTPRGKKYQVQTGDKKFSNILFLMSLYMENLYR